MAITLFRRTKNKITFRLTIHINSCSYRFSINKKNAIRYYLTACYKIIMRRRGLMNHLPVTLINIDFESKSHSSPFYKQPFSFIPLFCFTCFVTCCKYSEFLVHFSAHNNSFSIIFIPLKM